MGKTAGIFISFSIVFMLATPAYAQIHASGHGAVESQHDIAAQSTSGPSSSRGDIPEKRSHFSQNSSSGSDNTTTENSTSATSPSGSGSVSSSVAASAPGSASVNTHQSSQVAPSSDSVVAPTPTPSPIVVKSAPVSLLQPSLSSGELSAAQESAVPATLSLPSSVFSATISKDVYSSKGISAGASKQLFTAAALFISDGIILLRFRKVVTLLSRVRGALTFSLASVRHFPIS